MACVQPRTHTCAMTAACAWRCARTSLRSGVTPSVPAPTGRKTKTPQPSRGGGWLWGGQHGADGCSERAEARPHPPRGSAHCVRCDLKCCFASFVLAWPRPILSSANTSAEVQTSAHALAFVCGAPTTPARPPVARRVNGFPLKGDF